MLKIPSVQVLSNQFIATASRFKWVVLIAIVKTIFFIYLIETKYAQEDLRHFLTRILYVLHLALPLTLAVSLVVERRRWKLGSELIFMAALAALLTFYFFFTNIIPSHSDTYRCILLVIGAHFLVSYIAFIGYDEPNGFWQFNKNLFLQFLNATLYSLTLFIGLLVAVEAVKFLFDITYPFDIEQDLAQVTFGIFHTVFFLSKVPHALEDLNCETDYPKGLKIFTQYVLLPLEVIYLLILYVYTGKIIFQWRLPEGRVAYLVVAFSIAGILALLLLYPLRESKQERWISLFSRRFYLALIPLTILLTAGIYRRIHEYGVTENRYVVAILACWLVGITIYFLSKKNDIRWIPITLSVLCLVVCIGPWNIFIIARKSQLKRFHTIVETKKLANVDGMISGNHIISKGEKQNLISIIRFFRSRDQAGLESYFPKPQTSQKGEKTYPYSDMEDHLDQHIKIGEKEIEEMYYIFSSQEAATSQQTFDISNFTRMSFVDFNPYAPKSKETGQWRLNIRQGSRMLNVYRGDKKITTLDLRKKMAALAAKHGKANYAIPSKDLSFDFYDGEIRGRLVLTSLTRSGETIECAGFLFY